MSLKARKVTVRSWTFDDIPAIVACHRAVYPEAEGEEEDYYDERVYEMQYLAFPEGQVLAETDGRVVAYATALIVQLDDEEHFYTYSEITGDGTFSSHDPTGDTLYGADIGVHPDYRRVGISRLLYRERKKLLKRYNLRRMVAYGRIPGYGEYVGRMTAQEYVDKVVAGKLTDPSLNAHLQAGYVVKRVTLDLLADDPSMNYCTLLELTNPQFKPEKRKIAAAPLSRPVRKVRVCAAQYLMRSIHSWEQLEKSVEFFVYTADSYHCHFLLMPELFTAQFFSALPPELEPWEAILELAALAERYCELFRSLAAETDMYIVGGSHPVLRDGELFNVAHLFTPTGDVYTQDKLHITDRERTLFHMRAGKRINVFDTPLARIAVTVGYDIEFPELTRLLTLSGAEIVFAPFSTDERKAYQRVRYTAQARAVENSIYVVISGNVGNLPSRNYMLNFGQAAIFTPSDFEFPPDAVAGEAEPNEETVIIADLDLNNLMQHRELGSTRPLYDRRPDLYTLRAKSSVRVVRTE